MEDIILKKYIIRTYAISWVSWLVLAILVNKNVVPYSSLIGTLLVSIGGFAPTISAISLQKNKSFKDIMNFIFKRKKGSIIYLLLFCLLLTLTIGLSSMTLNNNIPFYAVPIMFFILTFFGGGNEELGWRGTMQPIFEKKMAFPIATFLTGIIWAFWHFPLWLVNGSSQQSMPFPLFALYAIFLSFWLACIYKRTNCIFYCAVLHGLNNVLMSLFIIKFNLTICLGIMLTTIISVVLWYKKENSIKVQQF